MKGVVVRSTGSWYDVLLENEQRVQCRLKGIFRLDESKENDSNPVAVGDRVVITRRDGDDTLVIEEILPRDNYIVRASPKHKGARQVIAANLDQCVLIGTLAHPRTAPGFIDRFLRTAEAYHIPTVIVFNKKDLLDGKGESKQQALADVYRQAGYTVLSTAATTGEGCETLKQLLVNKTSLIAGHSGVGKSSLVNVLQPQLNLRTNNISHFTGKGMHTTTFAEMFQLSFGGAIIDTPGIKEFGLKDFKPEELSHYFVEMREPLQNCRFNNCLHDKEPGCAVRQAVHDGKISELRYNGYLNILLDYKAGYKHWEE